MKEFCTDIFLNSCNKTIIIFDRNISKVNIYFHEQYLTFLTALLCIDLCFMNQTFVVIKYERIIFQH